MARKAVIDALNSSLGRYVVEGDLDVSALPPSLWSGSIEITKEIRLNVDAINRDYFPSDETATAAASASAAAATADAEDAEFSKHSNSDRFGSLDFSGDQSVSQPRSDTTTATGDSGDNYCYNPPRRPNPFNRKRPRRRENSWTSPRRFLHEDWAINVNCPDRAKNVNDLTLTDLSRSLYLVSGSISSIRIDIPWAALASRPVVVKVSGLKLVFSPDKRPSRSNDCGPKSARTVHSSEETSHANSDDLAASRHGTSSLESPLGMSIRNPEVGVHRKVRSSESFVVLDCDDKHESSRTKPGNHRRWGFNHDRKSRSFNRINDGINEDSRHSKTSDHGVVERSESAEFDAQTNWRGRGIGVDIRVLGAKLKRALPLSKRVEREILKSKRNREESLVRDRRRKVMAVRDDRRRRHEALRRCILSSQRESDDHCSDHTSEASGSEGGTVNSKAVPRASLSCTSTFGLDDQRRSQGNEPMKQRRRRASISKPKTFRERLTRRLLENLQLEFANVRIELVDERARSSRGRSRREFPESATDSFPEEAFVLGVVMDSLVLNTTDEHGRRIYVDRGGQLDSEFLYKALRISGFGVYLEKWDEYISNRPADTHAGDSMSVVSNDSSQGGSTAITEGFSDDISIASALTNNMLSDCTRRRYVLNPISFEAAYRQREAAVLRSASVPNSVIDSPKYLLFCQMPHLWLAVSQAQLQLTNSLLDSVSQTGPKSAWRKARTNIMYPEYRPACSLTAATAKDWWRYAVRAVGRMTRKTCWKELWIAFRHANRYIRLYRRHCVQETLSDEDRQWWRLGKKNDSASIFFGGIKDDGVTLDWLEPLTPDEIKEMEAIEDDRSISIEGIMRWRSAAERYVNKEWLRRRHEKQKASRAKASLALLKRTTSSGNLETLDLGDANDELAEVNPTEFIGNRRRANSGGGVKTLFGKEDLPLDNDSQDDEDDNETLAMTYEEIEDLKMELDSVPFSSLPLNSKLAEIEFSLGFVVVDVYWADLSPLSKLRVGTIEAKYSVAVGTNHSCALSISSIQLEDTTTINPEFPFIIRSFHLDEQDQCFVQDDNSHIDDRGVDEEPAISFVLQRQNLDQTELVLRVVPTEVVASLPFLSNVASFFSGSTGRTNGTATMMPAVSHVDGSRHLGTGILEFLNGTMKSGIEDIAMKTNDWIFDVDVAAPMLVLPMETGDQLAQCIVISFGRHQLLSSDDPIRSATAQLWINSWNQDRQTEFASSNGLQSPHIDAPPPLVRKCILETREVSVMMGTSLTAEMLASSAVGNQGLFAIHEKERPIALVEPLACSMEFGALQKVPPGEEKQKENLEMSWLDFVLPNISIHISATDMAYIASSWQKTSEQIAQFRNSVKNSQGLEQISCDASNSSSQHDSLQSLLTLDAPWAQEESGNGILWTSDRTLHCHGEIEKMSVTFELLPSDSFEATARSLVATIEKQSERCVATVSFGGVWVVDFFNKACVPRSLLALEFCEACGATLNAEDTPEKVAAKLTVSLPAPRIRKEMDSGDNSCILGVILDVQRLAVDWHTDRIAEFMGIWPKTKEIDAADTINSRDTAEVGGRARGDFDNGSFDDDSLLSPPSQEPTFIQLRQFGSTVFPSWGHLQNAVLHRSSYNQATFAVQLGEVGLSIHHRRGQLDSPDVFSVALRNNSLEARLAGENNDELNLKIGGVKLSFLCLDIALANQVLFEDASNNDALAIRHSKRKSRVGTDHRDTRCSGSTIIKVSAPKVTYLPATTKSLEVFLDASGLNKVLAWTTHTAIDFVREVVGYHTMDQVVDISFTDLTCSVPVDVRGSNSLALHSGETVVRIGSAPFGGGGRGNVEMRELMLQFTERREILEEPFEIGVDIQFCSMIDHDEAPVVKFGVTIPSIQWSLSTKCIADARTVVSSLLELTFPPHCVKQSAGDDEECVPIQTRIDLTITMTRFSLLLSWEESKCHPSIHMVASENSIVVCNLGTFPCSTVDVSLSRVAFYFCDRSPGTTELPLVQFGTDGPDQSRTMNVHTNRCDSERTSVSFSVPKVAVNVCERFEELVVRSLARATEQLESFVRGEGENTAQDTTRWKESKILTIDGEVKQLELAFIDPEDRETQMLLSGEYSLKWQSTGNETDGTESYASEVQAQDVVVRSIDLNNSLSIQILAPASFSVVLDSTHQTTGTTTIEPKIASLTEIDVDLSTGDSFVLGRTVARVSRIVMAGLSTCCSMESLFKKRALRQTEDKGEHVEMCEQEGLDDDDSNSGDACALHVNCVLPRMRLTLIDDLGEVLRPLFRLKSENSIFQFESKGDTTRGEEFERKAQFSFEAEVFCPLSRRWEALMSQWDGTLVSTCAPIVSGRLEGKVYRRIDMSVDPFQVSLSETVLKHMHHLHTIFRKFWTQPSKQSLVNGSKPQKQASKDLVALKSGRTRYGLRNYSGVDLEYFLIGDIDYQLCRSGETKIMDFGEASAADEMLRRRFGQDLPSPKTIIVRIADSTLREKFPGVVIVRNMDEEIGDTVRPHSLDDGKFIYSKVEVSGDTIILNIQSWLVVHNYTALQPSIHLDHANTRTALLCCTNADTGNERCTFAYAVSGVSKDQNSMFKASESGVVVMIEGRGNQNYKGVVTPFKDENMTTSILGFCQGEGLAEEFAVSVTLDKVVVDGYVAVELSLRPMTVVKNLLPMVVSIRTSNPNALRLPASEEKRIAPEQEHSFSYNRTTALKLAVAQHDADNQVSSATTCCLQLLDGAKAVRNRYHCDSGIFLEPIEPAALDLSVYKPRLETMNFAVRARTTIVDHTNGHLIIQIKRNNEQDIPLVAVESGGATIILVPYRPGEEDDDLTMHISTSNEVRAPTPLRCHDVVRASDAVGSKPLLGIEGEPSGIFAYKIFGSSSASQEVHLVAAFEFFNNTQLPLTITSVGNSTGSTFLVDAGTSSVSFWENMTAHGITLSFRNDATVYVSDALFPFDIGTHDVCLRCTSSTSNFTLTLEVSVGGRHGRSYIVISDKIAAGSISMRNILCTPFVKCISLKLRGIGIGMKRRDADTKDAIIVELENVEMSFWNAMESVQRPDAKDKTHWNEWFQLRSNLEGMRISDCNDDTEVKVILDISPSEHMGLIVRGQRSTLFPTLTTIDSANFTLVEPSSSIALHIDEDSLGQLADIGWWCKSTLSSVLSDWSSETGTACTMYKVKELVLAPIRATATRRSKKSAQDDSCDRREETGSTRYCELTLHQLQISHWKGSLPALLRFLIAVFECRWQVAVASRSEEESKLVIDIAATEDEAVFPGRTNRTDLTSFDSTANKERETDEILAIVMDEILNTTKANETNRKPEAKDAIADNERKPIANFLKRFRKQRKKEERGTGDSKSAR